MHSYPRVGHIVIYIAQWFWVSHWERWQTRSVHFWSHCSHRGTTGCLQWYQVPSCQVSFCHHLGLLGPLGSHVICVCNLTGFSQALIWSNKVLLQKSAMDEGCCDQSMLGDCWIVAYEWQVTKRTNAMGARLGGSIVFPFFTTPWCSPLTPYIAFCSEHVVSLTLWSPVKALEGRRTSFLVLQRRTLEVFGDSWRPLEVQRGSMLLPWTSRGEAGGSSRWRGSACGLDPWHYWSQDCLYCWISS